MPRPGGFWHAPGLLYDLAFCLLFRSLRRQVARAVERRRLYPWLDVCCGTGDQLRRGARGSGRGGRNEPPARSPIFGSDAEPGLAGDEASEARLAVGLDMDFGMVRYAAARAPSIRFVCADAAHLPFKTGSMRAFSVSFGLHDKSREMRNAMLDEARRVLAPAGRLVAVDFENPWNAAARAGALFAWAIERLAGGEHYRNGREFLRRGGLRALLLENGFVELERRNVETGSLGVVVARPGG